MVYFEVAPKKKWWRTLKEGQIPHPLHVRILSSSYHMTTVQTPVPFLNQGHHQTQTLSWILNLPIGFQSGLKVQAMASTFTIRLVKNLVASMKIRGSLCRGTSAPCSSSLVKEKQDQRSLNVAMVLRNEKLENPKLDKGY